jgi:membrane protein implicated in regulation of membrane protease activity
MSRVLAKYLLFQVPGWVGAVAVLWALVRWWELDPRLAALLFGLWLVKDAVLFPVLRIGYETPEAGAADRLVGESGVTQDALQRDRVGWVQVGAELWRARLDGDSTVAEIPQGAPVRVKALQDNTLIVEAVPDEVAGTVTPDGGSASR